MTKRIIISPDKCTGCRTCELTCSFNKHDDFNPKDAAISVHSFENEGIDVPITCLQCDEPDCVAACPVNALEKDELTGVVNYDSEKCIKCKLCVKACPYGSITYSPRLNEIIKCDECGGDPQCVKLCPSGAITYGELDSSLDRKQLVDKYFKEAVEEVTK